MDPGERCGWIAVLGAGCRPLATLAPCALSLNVNAAWALSLFFLAISIALAFAGRRCATTTRTEPPTRIWQRHLDRLVALVVLGATLAAFVRIHLHVGLSVLSAAMGSIVALKLVIADRCRRRRRFGAAPQGLRVCAVMPLHNEDPAYAVAGVASLLNQTRPLDRIHVIDDGSSDRGAAADAVRAHLEAAAPNRDWEVTVFAANLGKRHALAHGFRADERADIYLCVDSDTVLQPDAVAEGLRPFSNHTVTGVAGLVSAHNRRRNLLTRLIDLRYVSAFLSERAAYSAFGAVLCCCGSLSFYRASVIRENLHDFLNQLFLGKNATFGDDRRLTNYALRAGKVVLAERSRAATAVPERLNHYVRQQVRWNKSFFRESLWVISTFPVASAAFWLTVAELATWIVFGSMLVVTSTLILANGFDRVLPACTFVFLAAWARNTAYLEHHRDGVTRRDRLFVFALAPLYGLLHLVVLMPVRLYALATLNRARWGTRATIEVHLS